MSALVYICKRCGNQVTEPCADPAVEIRRRIENRELWTVHSCPGTWLGKGGAGALGIAELIGEAERPAEASPA